MTKKSSIKPRLIDSNLNALLSRFPSFISESRFPPSRWNHYHDMLCGIVGEYLDKRRAEMAAEVFSAFRIIDETDLGSK